MPGLFDPILNWRLLPGSHAFPGPDGGTCINEAAVGGGPALPGDPLLGRLPALLLGPLAAYALGLNDAMPDAERPRLMAFVLRLAGSADSEAVRGGADRPPRARGRAPPAAAGAGAGPGWRSTPPPAGPRRMWERP